MKKATVEMKILNIGGTAIGTKITTDEVYFRNLVPHPFPGIGYAQVVSETNGNL